MTLNILPVSEGKEPKHRLDLTAVVVVRQFVSKRFSHWCGTDFYISRQTQALGKGQRRRWHTQ